MTATNNFIANITAKLKGDSLKAKCAHGALTLTIGTGFEKSLKFIRNMLLARLLAPESFGVLAKIFVAVQAFEALYEVGTRQSIIQSKDGASQEYLNIAWWVQFLRGICLFIVGYLAAPWISHFFESPELTFLMRISFLSILFRSMLSPCVYVLEKEHKFKKVVLIVQGSSAIGTVCTILLAFFVRNVWALVIGSVTETVLLCVISYIIVPFVPSFHINRESLKKFLSFAKGMFGQPLLVMICFQLDIIVLGKLVSDESLGMYYLAVMFMVLPTELYSRIISTVLLPAFAKKQDDKKALSYAVIKMITLTSNYLIPLVIFLFCCSEGLILFVYGAKFTQVAITCGVLCTSILARSQSSILTALYFGLGKPELNRIFVILRVVVIGGLIYPLVIQYGLIGAAISLAIGNYLSLAVQSVSVNKYLSLSFYKIASCYIPGVLLSLPIIVLAVLLKFFGAGSLIIFFSCLVVLLISGFVYSRVLLKSKLLTTV